MSDLFWLSDAQWKAIKPLLPRLGGKPRVDDRRVISGVLHRFREGLRWRAVPDAYGPRTTLFNRFNRWSQKGIWQSLLAALAACDEPPAFAMVDSTAVRAHRSAAGAKGGSSGRQSAVRAADQRPRSTPSLMAPGASTR
jgi:transposase